jgi:hypothetical protein
MFKRILVLVIIWIKKMSIKQKEIMMKIYIHKISMIFSNLRLQMEDVYHNQNFLKIKLTLKPILLYHRIKALGN